MGGGAGPGFRERFVGGGGGGCEGFASPGRRGGGAAAAGGAAVEGGGGAFRLAVCASASGGVCGRAGCWGWPPTRGSGRGSVPYGLMRRGSLLGGVPSTEGGGSGGGAKDPLSLEENILGLPFGRDTCGVVVVRTSFVLILPPSPLHPFRSCCSAELYICKAEALVTSKV